MTLPAGATLTNATCVKARIEYPFRDQGDGATKVYHHTMQQKLTSYTQLDDDDTMTTATEKPENSPFPDDADAFYVGDSPTREIDGGMVEFNRMFANVPEDRIEPNGFYAFAFPATPQILSGGSTTSESSTYNVSTFIFKITATLSPANADKFTEGDSVTIGNTSGWDFTALSEFTLYEVSGTITKSGDTITMKREFFYYNTAAEKTAFTGFTDNSPASFQVAVNISPERLVPITLNSPSIIQYSYVKNRSIPLIGLKQKFQLSTSGGNLTDTLTGSTTPLTSAQYAAAAINGQSLAAENETLEQWHGNIYQKAQILVKLK